MGQKKIQPRKREVVSIEKIMLMTVDEFGEKEKRENFVRQSWREDGGCFADRMTPYGEHVIQTSTNVVS